MLPARRRKIHSKMKVLEWSQKISHCKSMHCLFDLILFLPSTIFQLNRDRSSWVEPVLSWDKCVSLKDPYTVMPVRLDLRPLSLESSTLPLSHCAPISLCRFFMTRNGSEFHSLRLVLLKFQTYSSFIVDLVTCKNEEDAIKMKALEWSQHYLSIIKILKEY